MGMLTGIGICIVISGAICFIVTMRNDFVYGISVLGATIFIGTLLMISDDDFNCLEKLFLKFKAWWS
jgi:hypothetical protein